MNIISFLRIYFIFNDVYVFDHVSVGDHGGQKRAPELLELELQVVLSC